MKNQQIKLKLNFFSVITRSDFNKKILIGSDNSYKLCLVGSANQTLTKITGFKDRIVIKLSTLLNNNYSLIIMPKVVIVSNLVIVA